MKWFSFIILVGQINLLWAQSNSQLQDSLDAIIEVDIQYQKVVTTADNLFEAKNYVKALTLYERAISIKPNDSAIPAKIILTQDKLTCANCNTYEKVIFKADKYYEKEAFNEALKLYKRSQVINPSDAYPQEMIDKINKSN